jgi:hypothetical protein
MTDPGKEKKKLVSIDQTSIYRKISLNLKIAILNYQLIKRQNNSIDN